MTRNKVNPRSLKFHTEAITLTSYFPLKSCTCLNFNKQEPTVTNETLKSIWLIFKFKTEKILTILHTNECYNGNHFAIITIESTMYLLLSTSLKIILRGRRSICCKLGWGQFVCIISIYENSRYVTLVINIKNRETRLEHKSKIKPIGVLNKMKHYNLQTNCKCKKKNNY